MAKIFHWLFGWLYETKKIPKSKVPPKSISKSAPQSSPKQISPEKKKLINEALSIGREVLSESCAKDPELRSTIVAMRIIQYDMEKKKKNPNNI